MSSGGTEVIGGKNFWLYSQDKGYDLTHPTSPTSPLIFPRIPLKTKSGPVAIDPSKTALVIIDLQNYFVAPELGRPSDSLAMHVIDMLLKHAIPSCREAGIPIVWLGWGLTEEDIDDMPPTIIKGFAADTNFVSHKKLGPLGSDIGLVGLEDGSKIDAGRAQQNDIYIYKNRLSGFWGGTGIEDALTSRGIKTLLFAGCNTDQCVGGSIQDAYTKGWDCLLLSDGTATTSPYFAQQSIEYNCEGGWGFVLTCEQLADGVRNMQKAAA